MMKLFKNEWVTPMEIGGGVGDSDGSFEKGPFASDDKQ